MELNPLHTIESQDSSCSVKSVTIKDKDAKITLNINHQIQLTLHDINDIFQKSTVSTLPNSLDDCLFGETPGTIKIISQINQDLDQVTNIMSKLNLKHSKKLEKIISDFNENHAKDPNYKIKDPDVPIDIINKLNEALPKFDLEKSTCNIELRKERFQNLKKELQNDLRSILGKLSEYYFNFEEIIEKILGSVIDHGNIDINPYKTVLSEKMNNQLSDFIGLNKKYHEYLDIGDGLKLFETQYPHLKTSNLNEFTFGPGENLKGFMKNGKLDRMEESKLNVNELSSDDDGRSIPEENSNFGSVRMSESMRDIMSVDTSDPRKPLNFSFLANENIDCIQNHLTNGRRFQLVDGKRDSICYKFIKEVFRDVSLKNKKVAVISLIGISSQDKADILSAFSDSDYMPSFSKSDSGVYGTLAKLPSSQHVDYLLFLDVENICNLDRSLVLIMARSNLSIVDLRKENKSIIQEQHYRAINCLLKANFTIPREIILSSESKSKEDNLNGIRKTIIFQDNIDDPIKLQIKEAAFDLLGLKNIVKGGIHINSLGQWLDITNDIFTVLEKDMDLSSLAALQEKMQHELSMKWIKEHTEKLFGDANKLNVIKSSAEGKINVRDYFTKIHFSLLSSYEAFSRNENFNKSIQENYFNMIESMVANTEYLWLEELVSLQTEEKVKISKQDGENKINDFLENFIKNEKSESKESAKQKFDNIVIQEIQRVESCYNPKLIKQDALRAVHSRVKIYEQDFTNLDEISEKVDTVDLNHPVKLFEGIQIFKEATKSFSLDFKNFSELKNAFYYFNQKKLNDEYYKLKAVPQSEDTKLFLSIIKEKMMKKYDHNFESAYFGFSVLFTDIRIEIDSIVIGRDGVRELNQEMIQKIISYVSDNLLFRIDDEGAVFGLQSTKEFSSAVYLYVIAILYRIYQKRLEGSLNKILEEFKEFARRKKSIYLDYFEPSEELDKRASLLIKDDMQKVVNRNINENCPNIFKDMMESIAFKFSRVQIQNELDKNMSECDDDWFYRYVVHPNKVIEQKFESIFNNRFKEINQEVQSHIKRISKALKMINENLMIIQKCYNDSSLNKVISSTYSNSKFSKREGQSMLIEIFDFLIGTKKSQEKLKKATNSKVEIKLSRLENDLLLELTKELKYYSINNPSKFIQNLITCFDEIQLSIESNQVSLKELDKKDLYKKFKDRAIGCYVTCPCCNRPCDAEHFIFPNISIGSEGNKHKCLLGHQFRGMNGYKLLKTHEPSLRLCEEMRDTNIIIYKGIRMTWEEFKKRFKTWDFETIHLSKDQLESHRAKFEMIWKRIGKRLCEEFGMVYTDTFKFDQNSEHSKACHNILVLDRSGSMAGDRWKSLKLSVKKFTTIRAQEDAGDSISCITFSDHAHLVFENLSPNAAACKDLGRPGGCTNYSSGLKMMSDLILKYKHKGRKFNVVFMSDGEATDDPSSMFIFIKKYFMEDIQSFWVVGYGEIGTEYLKKIAITFNGEFKNPRDHFELKNTFAEIARSQ